MMRLKNVRKVVFEPLTHTYIMGDRILKGVTSLMREQGLSPDYGGIPEATLRAAAERGTAIHSAIEDYDNGKASVLPPEARDYPKLGLNVIRSEYLVTDCRTVASMIDKVIYVDDHTVDLADIKTTSVLHRDSVSWQLSIYRHLFRLVNPDIGVRNLYAIHIRGGRCKLVQIEGRSEEEVGNVLRCSAEGDLFAVHGDEEPSASASLILTPEEEVTLADAVARLAEMKAAQRQLDEYVDGISGKMLAYMREHHIDEMSLPGGCVARLKDEYVRESIDTRALKADHPDIAERYARQSVVKAGIVFKTK